jgi:RNA polymerase sigma-70 factor, ECF subfamily
MREGSPREHFLAALPPDRRPTFAGVDPGLLADALHAALDRARREHPTVELPADEFLAHLAAHVPVDVAGLAAVAAIHSPDLYLACACATGSPAALAAFDALFRDDIDRIVSRGERDVVGPAELRQVLHAKLFLADDERPAKIREYSGRGSLRGWVRIAARRTYLDLMRALGRRREVPLVDEHALVEGTTGDDPEVAYLKRHYRQEFREAFATALAGLSVRERNLLRQSFVHRLSVDEIGKLHAVHRATAARWVAQARLAVLERTTAAMRERLAAAPGEVESILRLIESHLDVTVSRLLAPEP